MYRLSPLSFLGIQSGVPQGSILGPILFSLFINDLPACINHSQTLLYADDTVIFFSAKTIDELEMCLNLDLNCISAWLQDNDLFINLKKTEYVVFGTNNRLRKLDSVSILLNGESIERSTSFKYLGVILDDCLSFNDHIDYIKTKVAKRLGLFKRIRSSITIETANRMYKCTVLPILDYCDTSFAVLGVINSELLNRLHRRASKIVVGLRCNQDCTNLGWISLNDRRIMHSAQLVCKCLKGSIPDYFKNYFVVRNLGNQVCTRSTGIDLLLPKIKLEVAKRSFYYNGASIYNSLPSFIKLLSSPDERYNAISKHFYSKIIM